MINKQAQIFNSITPLDSSPGNYFWQEIEKNNLQRLYQTVKMTNNNFRDQRTGSDHTRTKKKMKISDRLVPRTDGLWIPE